jgi:hypothetical protein
MQRVWARRKSRASKDIKTLLQVERYSRVYHRIMCRGRSGLERAGLPCFALLYKVVLCTI